MRAQIRTLLEVLSALTLAVLASAQTLNTGTGWQRSSRSQFSRT